ncbi:MAG: hypothetical protein AB7S26_02035 [Sandaracinaceae bacterium]
MRGAIGLGVCAWVATIGPASTAGAQPSGPIVVYDFRGPRASSMRASLIRDFERHGVSVVDESLLRDIQRRMGLGRSIDGDEAVEVARELGAVAIVEGQVRRQRRRWRASVRVRNGYDGSVLGTVGWTGRTAATVRAVGRNGYDRLAHALARGRAPPARGGSVAVSAGGDAPWWQRRQGQASSDDPDEPDERDEASAPPTPRDTRYDAFRISLGGGLLYRSMSATVRVYASQRGLNPANPETETVDEQRGYQSGDIGHFEGTARAEIYPGAFDGAQSFPYLGALVSFSHSAFVRSNGNDRSTGDEVAIGTEQLELLAAARFRYRFGPARREPELHLDAGWGMFAFNLSTIDLQVIEAPSVVPPMEHGYVHLAAGLNYGVAPPYLTLGIEVFGRIGTNIGVDTRNVWGTMTAPSNGFGFEAEAKVDIAEGVFVQLVAQYFMFSTQFRGQVGCASASDCTGYMDPWSDTRLWEVWPVSPPMGGEPDLNAVVGGPLTPVLDNYFRLRLELGWAFY